MTVQRAIVWYIVRPVVLSLIYIGENWRDILAIIGGGMILAGMWGLITADVELYIDYTNALRHMALCWGLVIYGGLAISPWFSQEFGE